MFKRSKTVEIPTPASTYAVAREHLVPVMESAKESGTHALRTAMAAMVPVVAAATPAMAAAKHKGAELMNSDAAHEARDRAGLMIAAAKGEAIAKKRRRWPLVMAFFAVGSAIGAAVMSWLHGASSQPVSTTYREQGHAGPALDLSHPLTESAPEPVTVLSDADEASVGGDYSDPKATF